MAKSPQAKTAAPPHAGENDHILLMALAALATAVAMLLLSPTPVR